MLLNARMKHYECQHVHALPWRPEQLSVFRIRSVVVTWFPTWDNCIQLCRSHRRCASLIAVHSHLCPILPVKQGTFSPGPHPRQPHQPATRNCAIGTAWFTSRTLISTASGGSRMHLHDLEEHVDTPLKTGMRLVYVAQWTLHLSTRSLCFAPSDWNADCQQQLQNGRKHTDLPSHGMKCTLAAAV